MASTTSVSSESADIYSSLPLAHANDIRLVQKLAFEGTDITCELRVADLKDRPDYIALSYTWGPATEDDAKFGVTAEPTHTIRCNDRKLLITKNLYDLLYAGLTNGSFAICDIWVDMISINQQDEAERSRQVNIMSSIYAAASNVFVWLGNEDEGTEKSFRLVKTLSELCQDCRKQITPDNLEDDHVTAILGACSQVSYWTSLARLFQRRYFTRAWIIQEITLGKVVTVHCGAHAGSWDEFATVSTFLATTAWTRWKIVRDSFSALSTDTVHHGVPNILSHIQRAMKGRDINIMLDHLVSCRRFQASDPRDKVYALLGIADTYVKGKSRFDPIYGARTAAETFTLVARQILEDSNDLLLLSQAEGPMFQKMDLPSWVPDWSCARVLGLGVLGYKRFAAAGELPRSLTFLDSETPALKTQGMRLDHVVMTGESKYEFLEGDLCPKWWTVLEAMPSIYQQTGQIRTDVFWRTLITDTAGIERQHPAPPGYGAAFSAWVSMKGFTDSTTARCMTTLRNTVERITASEYETAFSHAQHLRLFLTSRAALGIGSESLQEHDSVWIVPGSRVPLILRETGDQGVFHIIGGAYVHGYMHGEALQLDIPFEEVTIV